MKEGKMVRREPHKSWKDLRRASAGKAARQRKWADFEKKV